MIKYPSLLLLPFLVGGCFLVQDFPANQMRLNNELTYICSTSLNTSMNSSTYQECRMYYDKILLQYNIDPGRPYSWDVSEFANRSRPLAQRCRSYSANAYTIWSCLQEQENMMLAEYVRKKLLREEQEAKKDLIRTQEYERGKREKMLIKESEKQKARYNPRPAASAHNKGPGKPNNSAPSHNKGPSGSNNNRPGNHANSRPSNQTQVSPNTNTNTQTIIINNSYDPPQNK